MLTQTRIARRERARMIARMIVGLLMLLAPAVGIALR